MKLPIVRAAIISLTLAGCNREAPGQDPADNAPTDPAAGATDTPEAQPTASIFSPEAEIENAPELLEPLVVSVTFPDGGADFDSAALGKLASVVSSEQNERGAGIVLRGHSDAGGSDDANMRASLARAEAVRDWLIGKGVAEGRISVIAFGEQNPAQPNALPDGTPNEEGRALNRRVEVTVNIESARAQNTPASDTAAQPNLAD